MRDLRRPSKNSPGIEPLKDDIIRGNRVPLKGWLPWPIMRNALPHRSYVYGASTHAAQQRMKHAFLVLVLKHEAGRKSGSCTWDITHCTGCR